VIDPNLKLMLGPAIVAVLHSPNLKLCLFRKGIAKCSIQSVLVEETRFAIRSENSLIQEYLVVET